MAIKNIITFIDKNPIIPMETPAGLLLIDKDMVIHALASNLKKIEIPKRMPKINYIAKNTRIADLSKSVYVVTDTGQQTGKYLAILDLR